MGNADGVPLGYGPVLGSNVPSSIVDGCVGPLHGATAEVSKPLTSTVRHPSPDPRRKLSIPNHHGLKDAWPPISVPWALLH
jgi:hypothetical protein